MESQDEALEQKRGLIQRGSNLGGVTNDGDALDIELAKKAKRKKIIKFCILGLLIVGVTLGIVLPLTLNKDHPSPTPPPLDYYNPFVVDPKYTKVAPYGIRGVIRVPYDYNAEHHQYVFNKLWSKIRGNKLGKSTFGVDSKTIPTGVNNKLIRFLDFSFSQIDRRVSFLQIKEESQRYSVPYYAVKGHYTDDNPDVRLEMVGFRMAQSGTFNFQFSDPLTEGNQYLNTNNCSFVFMDKFVQMDFNLPSQNLYGFGERIHEFGLKEGAWNMWAHGQRSPYDDGLSGRKGGYGVHPFILIQGKNKDDFFGIYFRNSNAMTPIITFQEDPLDGSKTSKLSFITNGGQLEIYFFIHGSALDIIKKYQEVMGAKPKLPPFWSLGWMQSSQKWQNQEAVENVIAQYKEKDLPLDTIFLDVQYLSKGLDFQVNTTAFQNISDLVNTLHANKQQIVPIINPFIYAENTSSDYYSFGNKYDMFYKSGQYKSEKYNNNLINQIYSKIIVFIDFMTPYSTNLFFKGLYDLYKQLKYDGIWINMNEPSVFQYAEIDPANFTQIIQNSLELNCRNPGFLEQLNSEQKNYSWYKTFYQGNLSTWFLPFLPDFDNYQNYDNNTMSLNATNSYDQTHYNVHSLYGHMMAKRVSNSYDQIQQERGDLPKDKRFFILTRSTFTSTGLYASHWLGENYREYRFMNYSISGIMNMNMFGIPHVGAEIGGFFGQGFNPQLFIRWTQLGTFYPMARFNYDINSSNNEPYNQFSGYLRIIRRTMFDRYQYLRLLYTCLFEVSNNGGSCFSPLFYYFPNDTNLYEEYESSFIFANTIKVTPILLENQLKVPAYFPDANGKWVSLINTKEILKGNATYNLDPFGYNDSLPVHLMPGKIISFQNNSDASIKNIHQLINGSITLLVNPDDNDFAQGSIFLDQGESLDELKYKKYEYYNLQFSQKSIQFLIPDGNPGSQPGYSIESIKILNGERFKNHDIACYLDNNTLAPNPLIAEWIEEEDVLKIHNIVGAPLKFSDIHSVHFSNNTEFNICEPKHFQYKVADGQTPILVNQTSVIFDLIHNPGILPDITLKLSIHTGNILNLGWTYKLDQSRTGKKMFKVPEEYVSVNQIPLQGDLSQFVQIKNSPFQIKFLNQDQGQTEFFGIDSLVYDDYLNWVNMHVATEQGDKFRGIFGLGERVTFEFFLKDGVYSMWTKDSPPEFDQGKFPPSNTYGVHPYFMFKHKVGSWVGILYNLAAAQDWWIKNDQTNGLVNLKTVAVGGRVDLYIIMGSTPEQVQSKYLSLIGKPVLIPQWALGWNQCTKFHRNLDKVKEILNSYRNNNIPLDVICTDNEYMKDYRNFIYDDNVAFKGLPDFINSIHSQGMRYVPIIDSGIAARPLPIDNYTQYQDGIKNDIFLKIQGETFIGQQWANDVAYPDFLDPVAIKWWQDNLDQMHKLLPFDGLCLNMNEFSNFCNGVCYQKQSPIKSLKTNLKYTPTSIDLELQNSVPIDAQHKNGDYQLDTHSISGISQVKATYEWFTNSLKARTFIIERSSSVGIGKWASRWLGDTYSSIDSMKQSVQGIMLMNMFGIPLVGADICGTLYDVYGHFICEKQQFQGAFYPFSKFEVIAPDYWGINGINRDAIKIKYALVRYYYTELFALSTKDEEGTFYKPLFFEFPDDYNSTNRIEFNIMLGSALKLSIDTECLPTLELCDTTEFYFPMGTWCRLLGNTQGENCFTAGQQGMNKSYPSQSTDYQLHLREGYTVPLQDTYTQSAKPFNNTKDLQNQNVYFHALGSVIDIQSGLWVSKGRYINDDGVSLNISGNYNSYLLQSSFDGVDTLTVQINMDAQASLHLVPETGCYFVNKNDHLGGIYFYNAENLRLKSSFDVTVTYKSGSTNQFKASYDAVTDRLVFDVQDADVCMSVIDQIKLVRSTVK